MVCDKVGCERWCVTKLYVKMVCDKVVCERWSVTKLGVKDGGVTEEETEEEAEEEKYTGVADLTERAPHNFVGNANKKNDQKQMPKNIFQFS